MPSLAPVDYDPFAAAKKAPPPRPTLKPVDHDPFAQDTALRGELESDVPGARITSTFRSPGHNRAVGGVSDSRHLTDDAVDFVPPKGMTRAQAEAAIRARDPHPQELLDEGDHVHYSPSSIPKLTPVDHDPFAAAPSPAKKAPSKAPAAAPPPFAGQSVRPAPGIGSDMLGEFVHGLGQDIEEQGRPENQNMVGQGLSAFDAIQRGISALTIPLEQRKQEVGDPRKKGEGEAAVLAGMVPIPGADEAGAAAGGLRRALMSPIERAEAEEGAALAAHNVRPKYSGAFGPKAARARETAAAGDAARLATAALPRPPKLTPVEGDPFQATAPKKRTLAAAVEAPPRTTVVGDEKNPATRTANALYRLGGHDTDARIELGRADTAMRKAHGPETDEALYHALEEPDKPMTPEVAAAKKELDPLLQRQTAVINRLRERADPTLDPYLTDTGYVHRIKAGDESALDENASRSPFESRKSLVRKADSQKQRKFIALEDSETGQRTLIDTSKDMSYRELRPGMEYRPPGEGPEGSSPKVFKVVSPTTKEIEAGSDVRYQKSAIHNTAVNVYQLERAERNLDVLEQTLNDMKERGVAHREEWQYRNADGRLEVARANTPTPKGFQGLGDTPQFKGWKFDHSDAQVQELKDWLPKQGENAFDALDRLNNFMLRSNFLSPFVHPKNIAEFWGASRGFDWLHPEGYGRLARTLPEATREVLTMGPKYRQLLREGSALLSADSRTQKFTTLLTDSAAKQMIEDPKGFAALKQAFGDAVTTPAKLYNSFQQASHKMMWSLGDIMMMQRVLELQEKGTPIRDAIRKAEDMIPNYRVPAQIMDSGQMGRILSKTFSNNRLFAIGRYHYNRLAAWGRMFKKIAVGSTEDRSEALGQFLVVAIQGAVIAPLLDKALQIATGNQNARVKRGGVTALPDAASRVASGQENPAQAIAQVLDLSPEAELGKEYIGQKDWKGDDLASKYKSTAGNIAGEAEPALDTFGPLQGGIEALQPGYGPQRVAGNMFGVELPQKAPGAVKGSTAKMLRSKYRKQDRKDPFVQTLEGLGVR